MDEKVILAGNCFDFRVILVKNKNKFILAEIQLVHEMNSEQVNFPGY